MKLNPNLNNKKDRLFSRKLKNSKQVITGSSNKILGRLATPNLGHEKRQAFAYLFCPKSYHRPNLLTPYGKLKYNLSLYTNIVLINNFD
jgi:hypothetical protein